MNNWVQVPGLGCSKVLDEFFFPSQLSTSLVVYVCRGDYLLEVSQLTVVQLHQDFVVQGCRHKDLLFPDRAERGNTGQLASIAAAL